MYGEICMYSIRKVCTVLYDSCLDQRRICQADRQLIDISSPSNAASRSHGRPPPPAEPADQALAQALVLSASSLVGFLPEISRVPSTARCGRLSAWAAARGLPCRRVCGPGRSGGHALGSPCCASVDCWAERSVPVLWWMSCSVRWRWCVGDGSRLCPGEHSTRVRSRMVNIHSHTHTHTYTRESDAYNTADHKKPDHNVGRVGHLLRVLSWLPIDQHLFS